jgi:DNA-binding GntR family transcriptional regulator
MTEGAAEQYLVDPFERVSTTDHVLRSLRAAIVDGRLAQGEQLREVQLAASLGTGRSAVREALRQLVQEGLAQHEVHRGTFVRTITSDDIVDVYCSREAIETTAVALILEDDAPDLSGVRAALGRMQDALLEGLSWRELADRDITLHEALVAASGSPRLARMYITLAAESRMHLYRYPPYPHGQNVVDHEQIVEALEAGRPEAEHLLREHLRFSARLAVAWRRDTEGRA